MSVNLIFTALVVQVYRVLAGKYAPAEPQLSRGTVTTSVCVSVTGHGVLGVCRYAVIHSIQPMSLIFSCVRGLARCCDSLLLKHECFMMIGTGRSCTVAHCTPGFDRVTLVLLSM